LGSIAIAKLTGTWLISFRVFAGGAPREVHGLALGLFDQNSPVTRGITVDVERPVHVRVRATDEDGGTRLVEASGLEARVIQHEMDHLDGVLILDRTTRDERKRALRELREAERASEEAA